MPDIGIRSGTVVGGGEGYDDYIERADADYVVEDRTGLLNAADQAGSREIIYVPGHAEIDLGTNTIVLDGSILASDRGRDGSDGALIYRDEEGEWWTMIEPHGGRVTGLRVRGSHGEYDSDRGGNIIRSVEGDVEVDNCELWDGGYAAVGLADNTARGEIHHCHIHDTQENGRGYGVEVTEETEIYANHFNRTRHSIAGGGRSSYNVYDNLFGDDMVGAVVDMHCEGGGRLHVHHNRCEAETVREGTRFGGDSATFFQVRGVSSDGATCEYNWIFADTEPEASEDSWPRASIRQVTAECASLDGGDFTNFTIRDNHFGPDEPENWTGGPDGEPGDGDGNGNENGNGDGGDPFLPAEGFDRRLVIMADENIEYSFTVTSDVAAVEDLETEDGVLIGSETEYNDEIETGDGFVVTGLTGNGEGDTWDYSGDVTGFDVLEGEGRFYLDGQEVTLDELVDDDGSGQDDRVEELEGRVEELEGQVSDLQDERDELRTVVEEAADVLRSVL